MYSSHGFYIDHFLFSGKYNLAALERGYEGVDAKLRKLGARIQRIEKKRETA